MNSNKNVNDDGIKYGCKKKGFIWIHPFLINIVTVIDGIDFKDCSSDISDLKMLI